MPTIRLNDTISAIATPPGEGGVGIIRLSGPRAILIADKMFRAANKIRLSKVPSRTAHFGHIATQAGEVIDEVLVTVFGRPKSYTGENVVEISAHGGSFILRSILDLSFSLGARAAEPGEFTKRAFLNGRMNLMQAEAVADLIRAKTEQAHRVALAHLKGKLSSEVFEIKEALLKMLAHMEAYLDFPEEHLEVYSDQGLREQLEQIKEKLSQLASTFLVGELIRDGALVVIIGRPNVGKSSLLNALLGRDRAIVSEISGTTRDTLEESMDLNGCLIRLTDTAGLSKSLDPLEQAGMERTKRCLAEGDLFIWVVDGSVGIQPEDREIFNLLDPKKVITVANKSDLLAYRHCEASVPGHGRSNLKTEIASSPLHLSCKTLDGILELKKLIQQKVLSDDLGSESILVTRLRHKRALQDSLKSLKRSIAALKRRKSLEFVTLDLRTSLDALRELVGEVYSDDLLDVIFREFCIGK